MRAKRNLHAGRENLKYRHLNNWTEKQKLFIPRFINTYLLSGSKYSSRSENKSKKTIMVYSLKCVL